MNDQFIYRTADRLIESIRVNIKHIQGLPENEAILP